MANNYETSTILQTIPDRLLNDLDHRVLREMGATIEKTHDGSHYLCMEDYSVDFWFIEPERLPEIIGLFQDCYPEPEKAPKWVERLLEEVRRIQKIDELHPGDPQTLEIDFNEVGVDWHDVLQSLLEKPENTGPDRLDAIEIKAAYWCEKPRPHEFGGHVTRITRDDIDVIGIDHVLEFMRKGGSIDFDGGLTATPVQPPKKPVVLNEPEDGASLYEAIVTHDASCSAVIRVYANSTEEAREMMSDSQTLQNVSFDLDDDNMPNQYYLGDEDAIEKIDCNESAA